MIAQKRKKKKKPLLVELFCIFPHLLTQNQTNQGSPLSWFSRPYETLLENPKAESSRELFLPENDFKTCYWVNFLKKHQICRPGKQTKTWNSDFNFFFTCPYTYINPLQYKNCFGHLIGTSSKYYKFWDQNFKRIIRKG